jgi:hypothetical protein
VPNTCPLRVQKYTCSGCWALMATPKVVLMGAYALVEALPGFSQVGGPQYSALFAAEVHAYAGV